MKNLKSFLTQCIAEVITEPVPQPPRKLKGFRSFVKQCIAEVIVETGHKARKKKVHGNPQKLQMAALIKECTLEVLKENLTEAFDPTSVGPNAPQDNPYPAWNAKMRTLEEEDGNHALEITPTGEEDDWSRPIYVDNAGKRYVDINLGNGKPSIHTVTPDGEPLSPVKNFTIIDGGQKEKFPNALCPRCKNSKPELMTNHPDGTKTCNYCHWSNSTNEAAAHGQAGATLTFQQIRDKHDPKGTNHDLTLECIECGCTHTCRCSKPKKTFKGICDKCAKSKANETIGGGIDSIQESKTHTAKIKWDCPHCKQSAGIIVESESKSDYIACADCQHCGKEISDPKLDKVIYETVLKHYLH